MIRLGCCGKCFVSDEDGVHFADSWSYGVMVSTLDFESSDPGSNPGRTSFLCLVLKLELLLIGDFACIFFSGCEWRLC